MGAALSGWAPVRAAMDEAAAAATVDRVVIGPAPCSACGAWIEWLGVGPWRALGTLEPHDCSVYLRGQADMAAYPQRWVTYPESQDRMAEASRELSAAWEQLRDELAGGVQPVLEWLVARWPSLTVRLALCALAVIVFFALALARWQAGLL